MTRTTVLIPLDGSVLAEGALRYVPVLKPLGELWVRLIGVCDVEWDVYHPELAERLRGLTEGYLHAVAERLRQSTGLPVETVCRDGRAAEEILKEAARPEVNLIALTSHARAGAERWRLGSVADKVIRGADLPTLVIGPEAVPRSGPLALRSILVPLDGYRLAEGALPLAKLIAREFGAALHLARVVYAPIAPDDEALGSVAVDVIQSLELTAALYLKEVRQELELDTPVEVHVEVGPPADALLGIIREHYVDLVVMGSHGRSGVARWALGSVADRLVRGQTPVLLVRPPPENVPSP